MIDLTKIEAVYDLENLPTFVNKINYQVQQHENALNRVYTDFRKMESDFDLKFKILAYKSSIVLALWTIIILLVK